MWLEKGPSVLKVLLGSFLIFFFIPIIFFSSPSSLNGSIALVISQSLKIRLSFQMRESLKWDYTLHRQTSLSINSRGYTYNLITLEEPTLPGNEWEAFRASVPSLSCAEHPRTALWCTLGASALPEEEERCGPGFRGATSQQEAEDGQASWQEWDCDTAICGGF